MEEFSRRVLVALVVAAAGPGAGMLALLLIAPAPYASGSTTWSCQAAGPATAVKAATPA